MLWSEKPSRVRGGDGMAPPTPQSSRVGPRPVPAGGVGNTSFSGVGGWYRLEEPVDKSRQAGGVLRLADRAPPFIQIHLLLNVYIICFVTVLLDIAFVLSLHLCLSLYCLKYFRLFIIFLNILVFHFLFFWNMN